MVAQKAEQMVVDSVDMMAGSLAGSKVQKWAAPLVALTVARMAEQTAGHLAAQMADLLVELMVVHLVASKVECLV